MKRTQIVLFTVLSLIAIMLPLIFLLLGVIFVPSQYTNTFWGRLDEKFEYLMSVDEPKIVVVGGSSVAFGLDSAKLEEYTGMPVVNFGLYAALGTKLMLDMSRPGINEGDIVVLSPELDPQTMSMYFSSETTLQAIDDDYSLAKYVRGSENKFSMIGASWKHLVSKLEYFRDGAPNPSGVYNSKNFNERGDVNYPREENVMEIYHDPNKIIKLDGNLLDGEFIDYVNEYVSYCERRGATVYFSYCPMNSLAMDASTSPESILEFEAALAEKLDCEIIGYADEYILQPGYFYDTNFHLNDVGVRCRTIKLAEDLLLAMENPSLIAETVPAPPALSEHLVMVNGIDKNEGYFTYTKLATGNYEISGLTELGRAQKTLTVPLSVRLGNTTVGIGVTSIGKGAFSGCAATEIIITEDTNIKQIMNGAFENAGTVSALKIYYPSAERLAPPTDNFSGVAGDFAVYVTDGSNYKSDYNWSENVKAVDIIPNLK